MMYEDSGQTKTLEDTLSSSSQARMVRLKVTLLSLTKSPFEYQVINYLCMGYQEMDIVDVVNKTRQHVNKTIKNFSKRLKPRHIKDLYTILKED